MLKRFTGIVVAIIPFGIVLALSITNWRILAGRLAYLGYGFFAVGGLISCANFYLSFLRYPIYRLLGGTEKDYHWVSGFPLFGVLALVGLAHLPRSNWVGILTFIFLLIDTGGISWFVLTVWKDDSFWSQDAVKSISEKDKLNRKK